MGRSQSSAATPALWLYRDRIVEHWRLFKDRELLRLEGAEATVQPIGKSLTLRNNAVLVITGPTGTISRRVKGSNNVRLATQFAAEVNAAAQAVAEREGGSAPGG